MTDDTDPNPLGPPPSWSTDWNCEEDQVYDEPKRTGPGTNTGHGHLWERPDGYRVRCGGPYLCADCRALIPVFGTTEQKVNLAHQINREAELARRRMEEARPGDHQLLDSTTGEPKQLCTAEDIVRALDKLDADLNRNTSTYVTPHVVFCSPAEKDRIIQALMDHGLMRDPDMPESEDRPARVVVRASRLIDYGTTYVSNTPVDYSLASLMAWGNRKPVV